MSSENNKLERSLYDIHFDDFKPNNLKKFEDLNNKVKMNKPPISNQKSIKYKDYNDEIYISKDIPRLSRRNYNSIKSKSNQSFF